MIASADSFSKCKATKFRVKDGGGIISTADWLDGPPKGAENRLQELRNSMMEYFVKKSDPACTGGRTPDFMQRLNARRLCPQDDHFFSEHEQQQLKEMTQTFLRKAGFTGDWTKPDRQPLELGILRGLAQTTGDSDVNLVDILEEGVRAFSAEPIPASGVWRSKPKAEVAARLDLINHTANWKTARDDKGTVWEQVKKLVNSEKVTILPGGYKEAVTRWGRENVACGKLSLGKGGRLIGDSSCTMVNMNFETEDKPEVPGVYDMKCIGDGNPSYLGRLTSFVLDFKGAHLIMLLHPDDYGKALFMCHDDKDRVVYFYFTNCHFGARYSAYYWSRLSALTHRLLHVFLWIAHASLIYVDDSKYLFVDEVAPICSLLVMGLLTACNFPISWGKLQYGKQVNWIGFIWNYASQIFVSCPLAKVEKLQGGLKQLLVAGTRVNRDDLQSTTGLAMWYTSAANLLRPWLCDFYRNLQKPGPVWKSLEEPQVIELLQKLSDSCMVTCNLELSDVRKGWKLVEINDSAVTCTADLLGPRWKRGRVRLKFFDFDSKAIKVDEALAASARLFLNSVAVDAEWRVAGLPATNMHAAADAFATKDHAGIGGWFVTSPTWPEAAEELYWFSCQITRDMLPASWGMSDDLSKYIATFECIAQWVLLESRQAFGLPNEVSLRQHCDNLGVTELSAKLITTKAPLCYALQGLAFTAARAGQVISLTHRAGERNEFADMLSRLEDAKYSFFKNSLSPQRRFSFNLRELMQRPWCVSA